MNKKIILASTTGGFLFLFLFFKIIQAVNMTSNSYKIQWGNINIGSGEQSSSSYQLSATLGQIAPGKFSSTGYIVRAGFQYIHSVIPFSFTISDLSIDFGSLVAQTPKTATNTLTVSAGGAGGYQVLAYENHPLRSEQNEDIPDTTCDSGTCSETTADVWTQNTTYGFGFNMSGDDVPSDFVDSTYFRQFANKENNESPQVVMSSNSVTSSATATVTYKVNISSSQAAGNYENAITFVAIPIY
ncbi:hypothetical protein J7J95_01245 [bacterium]|nr:hypothetical protein [bacterium]